MNKILILYKKNEDRFLLEDIFSELVEKGVEILFTDKKEGIQFILEKEKPKLFLIDSSLGPFETTVPQLKLHEKKSNEGGIYRPFHRNQVLEKCLPFLDLSLLKEIEELPM